MTVNTILPGQGATMTVTRVQPVRAATLTVTRALPVHGATLIVIKILPVHAVTLTVLRVLPDSAATMTARMGPLGQAATQTGHEVISLGRIASPTISNAGHLNIDHAADVATLVGGEMRLTVATGTGLLIIAAVDQITIQHRPCRRLASEQLIMPNPIWENTWCAAKACLTGLSVLRGPVAFSINIF